jgi:hypothetical protein
MNIKETLGRVRAYTQIFQCTGHIICSGQESTAVIA